jgi:phosphoserine phosphatase RsbU/P
MGKSIQRFARRILLLHLALLAVLLGVVFFASHAVYQSAREQALDQARRQQVLLVNETASGLKGYYDSIFSDLELFKPINPDDEEADERIPEDETGQSPVGPARGLRVPPMLPLQLNGRVAHLFLVEKRTYAARRYGNQATIPTVLELVARNHAWIDALDRATISPLEQFEDRQNNIVRGFTLIGVPVGAKKNYVLVASVPVRATAKRFFDEVNRTDSGAFLLDENNTIMAASRADLIGARVAGSSADSSFAGALDASRDAESDGTVLLTAPFAVGSEGFAPAMITVKPVTVLDKQWRVAITSPLSGIDAVVSRLFRRAVFWAGFVALSMTAILVSTAVQLIRNRMRTDRERHQLLEHELKQAREIQLAWLPKHRPRGGAIDIATVNSPASRISGDFYNWFDMPDGRMAVVIGDVTGHGMAAAFLMATTQLLVRNIMPQTGDPGHCLEEINRQLCTQVFNGQFVTLQILVIDPQRRRVDVGTAGHPAPLVAYGESFQPLDLEPQLVLGVEKEAAYATQGFDLSPRSTLVLYTDGVVDAGADPSSRFGLDRLCRSLNRRFTDAQSLVDSITANIDTFRGKYPLSDDLTLVAIQLDAADAVEPAAEHRPRPAHAAVG